MVNGIAVRADIKKEYSAGQGSPATRKDIYSLACVVTLAYLSARNIYRVEREEKSGKGFADFIFHPKRKNLPGILLELKANDTPQTEIAQIKSKEYSQKLRSEKVTNILAVGLSYDTDKKEHQCIIEEV